MPTPAEPDPLARVRAACERVVETRSTLAQRTRDRDLALAAALHAGYSLRVVAAAAGMSWSGVRDRVAQLPPS